MKNLFIYLFIYLFIFFFLYIYWFISLSCYLNGNKINMQILINVLFVICEKPECWIHSLFTNLFTLKIKLKFQKKTQPYYVRKSLTNKLEKLGLSVAWDLIETRSLGKHQWSLCVPSPLRSHKGAIHLVWAVTNTSAQQTGTFCSHHTTVA